MTEQSDGQTVLESIQERARRIDAHASCSECDFGEPFAAFLDRDGVVNVEEQNVEPVCPDCGCETFDILRPKKPQAFAVAGLEELDRLTGGRR